MPGFYFTFQKEGETEQELLFYGWVNEWYRGVVNTKPLESHRVEGWSVVCIIAAGFFVCRGGKADGA